MAGLDPDHVSPEEWFAENTAKPAAGSTLKELLAKVNG